MKERKELEEPLAYQELILPVAIAQSVRSLRKTSETSWYLRMKNLRSAREWRLLWLQHHWLRLHHWRILSFNPLSMKLLRPEHPELGEILFDVICPRNLLKTKVILSLTYLVVLPLCYHRASRSSSLLSGSKRGAGATGADGAIRGASAASSFDFRRSRDVHVPHVPHVPHVLCSCVPLRCRPGPNGRLPLKKRKFIKSNACVCSKI